MAKEVEVGPASKTTWGLLITVALATASGTSMIVASQMSMRNSFDNLAAKVSLMAEDRWTYSDQYTWVMLANAARPAEKLPVPEKPKRVQ